MTAPAIRLGVLLGWLSALVTLPPVVFAQRGGFSSGVDPDLEIRAAFDRDRDGMLDPAERMAARRTLAEMPWGSRAPGPQSSFAQPGPQLTPADVPKYGDEPFYEPGILRTLFIEFERPDWEDELQDFFHTDVEVPARLTVDGITLEKPVGLGFRGHASYSTIPFGRKRSFNVSIDAFDEDQRLLGYRSLNLMNAAADPTFLRMFLYFQVSRAYGPAPKANFVRVVINGESWGVYVNVQQVNTEFARENFGPGRHARWKIPGSGRSLGGLAYLGEDVESYRREYEIKSRDDPESWNQLIELCRVLNTTPAARLPAAIEPLLDVDGALRFLAVDKALINNDGYWSRASDYGLVRTAAGRFHVIPWDANETWREQRGNPSVDLDPFAGGQDPRKALMTRLLVVPEYRQRYLGYLRDIAENWLSWSRLEPLVRVNQNLIAADVRTDTRKLYSTEAFTRAVTEDFFQPANGRTAPPRLSLRSFAAQRRAYLLAHPAVRASPAVSVNGSTRPPPATRFTPPFPGYLLK